jgi:hypothetical protein
VAVAFAWRMRQSTASHAARGSYAATRPANDVAPRFVGERRHRKNLDDWAHRRTGYGRPDPKQHSTTRPNGHVIPPDAAEPPGISSRRTISQAHIRVDTCAAHEPESQRITVYLAVPAVSSTRFCADLSGLSSAHITANTTAARRRRAVRQAPQRGRVYLPPSLESHTTYIECIT